MSQPSAPQPCAGSRRLGGQPIGLCVACERRTDDGRAGHTYTPVRDAATGRYECAGRIVEGVQAMALGQEG